MRYQDIYLFFFGGYKFDWNKFCSCQDVGEGLGFGYFFRQVGKQVI